ncbi:TetR/AcrR family transcriptional regulator [Plantactinospora sp. GCM10030261]|uniref:TetR/AcrR family transcriptional regulator n=1 Tax=Plantactinospora sp. GCM10030261 TaxID=3273420 RepID=UPI003619A534
MGRRIGRETRSGVESVLTPAGERILEAASELFYTRGIGAVGVELIAERAGTTKKTLYDVFGAKATLVATYLARRSSRWREFVLTRIGDAAPEDRVHAVFDAAGEWHRENPRGCAFVNAYAELDEGHPAMAVIRDEKRWMADLFRELCTDDHRGTGGAAVAGAVHLLYEGALVLQSAGGEADAMRRARESAARICGVSSSSEGPA